MFHGHLTAAALADQLAARFNERHNRTAVSSGSGTALIQIGSKHGTPVSVHIADTEGGVLVTMSADRDWLDGELWLFGVVASGSEQIAAGGNAGHAERAVPVDA